MNNRNIENIMNLVTPTINFTIQEYNISYEKEKKRFVVEASDLGLPARWWNSLVEIPPEKTITLLNRKTGKIKDFNFSHNEKMNEEEVGVWIFKSKDGLELHILND